MQQQPLAHHTSGYSPFSIDDREDEYRWSSAISHRPLKAPGSGRQWALSCEWAVWASGGVILLISLILSSVALSIANHTASEHQQQQQGGGSSGNGSVVPRRLISKVRGATAARGVSAAMPARPRPAHRSPCRGTVTRAGTGSC